MDAGSTSSSCGCSRLCQPFVTTIASKPWQKNTGAVASRKELNRRRGRVIGEEMVENTDMILVLGEIPHSECFGLSAELVTASRGEAVVPILEIAGWVVCEKDPFWVPHSKEEREDYGEAHAYVDKKNEAKNAIAAVRKRKGLMGDLVLVQAEKQRTLKTNK